jgi:hypothetical protein
MAVCWIKAGECGQETSVEARKVDPTHVVFEITTTCEHIQALADALGEVDVAHDMSCPLERNAGLHAGDGARLPQQLHRARRHPESDGGRRRHLFAGRLPDNIRAGSDIGSKDEVTARRKNVSVSI